MICECFGMLRLVRWAPPKIGGNALHSRPSGFVNGTRTITVVPASRNDSISTLSLIRVVRCLIPTNPSSLPSSRATIASGSNQRRRIIRESPSSAGGTRQTDQGCAPATALRGPYYLAESSFLKVRNEIKFRLLHFWYSYALPGWQSQLPIRGVP
jgi:hypothetical protein